MFISLGIPEILFIVVGGTIYINLDYNLDYT